MVRSSFRNAAAQLLTAYAEVQQRLHGCVKLLQQRVLPRGIVRARLIHLTRYERWCCTTISINYRDSRPIYEQVRDGLRRLIVSGSLPLGEKLPSVRELSTQLTINPNTIQRAYRELESEGYIYTVSGKGSCSGRYHAAGKAGYFIGHKNMPRPASRSL